MKTKEYVKKYNLNTATHFSHNDFVADLSNDFIVNVEFLQSKNQLSLNRFNICIKEIRQKFDIISNRSKIEKKVWEKLWGYFFASIVAPLRDKMFGDTIAKEKQEREERRREYERKRYREDINDSFEWERDSMYSFFAEFIKDFYRFFRDINSDSFSVPKKDFETLGLSTDSTEDEIKKRYRVLAIKSHPDKGGSEEEFKMYTAARNKCLSYVNSKVA